MTQNDYKNKKRECWEEYLNTESPQLAAWNKGHAKEAFDFAFDRAYALGKQEKDAGKKTALTDKEMYALESAISELESLMDGTLDEDYHKEQTSIINALKLIIKKYEKK